MVDFGDRLTPRGAPWRPTQPERPIATYGLLGAIAAVFVLEVVTYQSIGGRYAEIFAVQPHWWLKPWGVVLSPFSHAVENLSHILFNGLFLFMLGPVLERIIGKTAFVVLFVVSGMVSGIAQVELSQALGEQAAGALGASGALMAIFGALMVIVPSMRILIMMFIPTPMWVAGLAYAVLDLVGAFSPNGLDNVGHFAHLSGMAIGMVYGFTVKRQLAQRGMRVVVGR